MRKLNKLRYWLDKRKIQQKIFAKMLGVTPVTVCSWVRNIHDIRPKHSMKVCEILKITESKLFYLPKKIKFHDKI